MTMCVCVCFKHTKSNNFLPVISRSHCQIYSVKFTYCTITNLQVFVWLAQANNSFFLIRILRSSDSCVRFLHCKTNKQTVCLRLFKFNLSFKTKAEANRTFFLRSSFSSSLELQRNVSLTHCKLTLKCWNCHCIQHAFGPREFKIRGKACKLRACVATEQISCFDLDIKLRTLFYRTIKLKHTHKNVEYMLSGLVEYKLR